MGSVVLNVDKNTIDIQTDKNSIDIQTIKYSVSVSSSPSGLPGVNGSTWRSGEGQPNDSVGINGDFYVDALTSNVYKKNETVYVLEFKFSNALINDSLSTDGVTWSAAKLQVVDNRLKELENTTFKGDVIPTTSVNKGDTWYDTVNNIFYVYREYPVGSANFRWEPLIFKNDDTLDGGAF